MKRQLVRAVWAVCCPVRTPDRFKFTSASWLLGCWRCFFSTPGWLSHGDYFDSAPRCGDRVCMAPPEWPADCADVQYHLCRMSPGVVAGDRGQSDCTPDSGSA